MPADDTDKLIFIQALVNITLPAQNASMLFDDNSVENDRVLDASSFFNNNVGADGNVWTKLCRWMHFCARVDVDVAIAVGIGR